MNSYRSCIRTLTARNIVNLTIAPPAGLMVSPVDFKPVLFEDGTRSAGGRSFDTLSNIALKRIGLFSNFGDGLVWNPPWERVYLKVSAIPYAVPAAAMPGTVTTAFNSDALVGAATNFGTPPDIVAGSIVKIGTFFYVVRSVTNPLLAVLSDYAANNAGAAYRVITTPALPPIATTFYGIETFNAMFDHECWFPAATIGGGTYSQYFLKAEGVLDNGQPLVLLTKTIDTSYAGDPAYFDVKADFEMTVRRT